MKSFLMIGGAEGPTTTFLAGELGLSILNLFGLILVVLLLVPNIIYAIKNKGQENQCQNRVMNILEQIGRYSCMFLMVFNVGIAEFGFGSKEAFLIYLFGNVILMLAYQITWVLYFISESYPKQMVLAILPTLLFLLNGFTMRHWLLVVFAIIFGVSHIYVTNKNRV